MRTFNGLQIFTQQLTNSGQLDARYVRVTGNSEPANVYLNNINQNIDFFKETNFNITNTLNIFSSENYDMSYTGTLPNVSDGKVIMIKNHSKSWMPLIINSFSSEEKFENSDDNYLQIYQKYGVTLLGVKNNYYTGWISLNYTQGII